MRNILLTVPLSAAAAAVVAVGVSVLADGGEAGRPVPEPPQVRFAEPAEITIPALTPEQRARARTIAETDSRVLAIVGLEPSIIEMIPLLGAEGELVGAALVADRGGEAASIDAEWLGVEWKPRRGDPGNYAVHRYRGRYEGVETVRILVDLQNGVVFGLSPENRDARAPAIFEILDVVERETWMHQGIQQ